MSDTQEPQMPEPVAYACLWPDGGGFTTIHHEQAMRYMLGTSGWRERPTLAHLITRESALAYAEALAAHRVAQERERLRGYFRDALSDHGITWPGEVDILYDKCFGAPYVPDEAA